MDSQRARVDSALALCFPSPILERKNLKHLTTITQALTEAAAQDPELASYYDLHRQLFTLQENTRDEIMASLELADPAVLQARVRQGLPLLPFAQLPIEPQSFAELAGAVAQALTAYYPDLAGQTLPDAAGEWVALARRRFDEIQAQPNHEPSITLAEMSADQALKPYLIWAAEQITPYLDPGLWKRGVCPVCGGSPDLAFLGEEAGARRLVCSRCNSQWRYRRVGCPFCDNDDHTQIVYYPSEDEVYRLYVCYACQRYLKTVDLRQTDRRPADVERVTTVAMDVAAQEQGYR